MRQVFRPAKRILQRNEALYNVKLYIMELASEGMELADLCEGADDSLELAVIDELFIVPGAGEGTLEGLLEGVEFVARHPEKLDDVQPVPLASALLLGRLPAQLLLPAQLEFLLLLEVLECLHYAVLHLLRLLCKLFHIFSEVVLETS